MDQVSRLKETLADRYAFEREIGRGGMATVYLARDLQRGRQVAVKVLAADVSTAITGQRFNREIEIAARLDHPHILPLYESGEAAGCLYYVMPYVEGGTLRQRLEQEKQLPIDEALRIAREVAEALSYAHENDVLHRDIKPANILLGAKHALVADFGIARAIGEAGGDRLTESGIALGTAAYMSPEQAEGAARLDARSDLYGLACLVYEMLAGQAPYTGPSRQAVLNQHILATVPSVSTLRRTVPPAVDRVLQRALAKSPADRFATVDEFITALESGSESPDEDAWRSALRRMRPLTAALVLLGALTVTGIVWSSRNATGPVLDASLYAVFPFDYAAGVETPLNEVYLLHDALARWTGLSVADAQRVNERLRNSGSDGLTHSEAVELARDLGAGRYLRGSVSQLSDSIRVHVGVYEAAEGGTLLADHAIRLGPELAGLDSAFTALADRLLLGDLVPEGTLSSGTRSLPARRAFARGQIALRDWDLERANGAFSDAARLDPDYAEAHMWNALVGAWRNLEPARWRVAAEQAALGRAGLSPRDQRIADAALALARGELAVACGHWQRFTERAPLEYTAWYGLAHCLASDDYVLPEPTSPSGWAFRSSYHTALLAYQRAFELNPAILASLRPRSYMSLRRLFKTAGNERRGGRAVPPDTTRFAAAPEVRGDSIAFVPYPRERLARDILVAPAARDAALRMLRRRVKDVAVTWASVAPANPDAQEALAISLAMLGDPAALDTIRRARTVATEPSAALRIAASEIWLELAFGIPTHSPGIRRARHMADSVLAGVAADSVDPLLLTGLAALTGRAHLAASHAAHPAVAAAIRAPPVLAESAIPLLIYAAMGGPVDTLEALEQRVRASIEESLLPSERHEHRLRWLARSATLAFPFHELESVSEFAGGQDYLLNLQAAWVSGDTSAVRAGLQRVREARRNIMPSNLTLDALYPEADLLVRMGDLEAAAAWLDPTLRVLPQIAPNILSDPVQTASLLRAMALRAEIADRLGHEEAAREWAGAVLTLWSDADSFLRPVIASLRRVGRSARTASSSTE